MVNCVKWRCPRSPRNIASATISCKIKLRKPTTQRIINIIIYMRVTVTESYCLLTMWTKWRGQSVQWKCFRPILYPTYHNILWWHKSQLIWYMNVYIDKIFKFRWTFNISVYNDMINRWYHLLSMEFAITWYGIFILSTSIEGNAHESSNLCCNQAVKIALSRSRFGRAHKQAGQERKTKELWVHC